MAYIETPAESELYEADLEQQGYVANMTRVFAHRPRLWAAWRELVGALRGSMDWRRYELVTLAAARELRSSYCMLAHGKVLVEQFHDADEVRAIVEGHGPLDEIDRAVMELGAMVARDATGVTQVDVDRLHGLGLSDADILDVVAAASARCFFSKTLDGLGAEPDAAYRELDPALRDDLVVGRPIES
jgi:alkylhydroperoxidase family enzyme